MNCQQYTNCCISMQRLACNQTLWSLHSRSFSVIRSFSNATVIHAQTPTLLKTDQNALQNTVVQPIIDRHRHKLDESLSSLRIKDLSAILAAIGRPSSGLRPVLADRIASYLNTIAHEVDRLKLKIQDQLDINNGSLDSSNQSKSKIMFHQISQQMLPESIISIDIGIRNFAWVELSRDGEILRWDIEDLLRPSHQSTIDSGSGTGSGTGPENKSETEAVVLANESSTRLGRNKARARKKTVKPPIPFDSGLVAIRVDEIMRKIVGSKSIKAFAIEKQRHRTGGFHAILDNTFQCGVIEGMVHSWLAAWKNSNSWEAKRHRADNRMKGTIPIESVSPKAVAQMWGIGVSSTKNSDISQERKKSSRSGQAYRIKKIQSTLLVEDLINASRDSSVNFRGDLKVKCNPEIKSWYQQEKKRDDLSDSLLQAVSWFEWKQRAIKEAIERTGIELVSNSLKDHKKDAGKANTYDAGTLAVKNDTIIKKKRGRTSKDPLH